MIAYKVYQEDGINPPVDEYGSGPVNMEVDEVSYPLGDITNYSICTDKKPAEKEKVTRDVEMKNAKNKDTSTRAHNVYTDQYKARFFNFIYNDDMTAGKATKAANIPRSTAYRWYKDDQDKINRRNDDGEDTPGSTETKKVGRSRLLNDDHKEHLKKEFVDSPSATIDQAMENLIGAFPGLKISKSLVHQYMVNNCALSFKKAHLHSKQRNSPESIQNRYEWVKKWEQTDMDYMSNYVFLDESAFLINLKRTMAWSERGTRAEVAVPVLRAKTTTILGAVSVWGITNVQVRIPGASVKKRKIGGGSGKVGSGGYRNRALFQFCG